MTYGIRHSDKCSDKELREFRQDVCNYLNDLNFIKNIKMTWKTIRAFNCFGGCIRVYTGKINERIPRKLRRRLIAWQEPNGQWKGNQDAISELGRKGSEIWQRHYDPIKEAEYFSVFRTDWNSADKEIADNEREQLKLFLEVK